MAQYRQRERGQVVRLVLRGGLLVATLTLCGCSSPSIPSWAMETPKSQYLMEKRMAQRSHQKRMLVAPTAAHAKANYDGSYIGGASSKSEYLEPFSKEWHQDQETEQRRIDALLTICRAC
jgi:hypothetical protein